MILYVSTIGSDITGDGSINNPYSTINKALIISNNGDTIKLMNGTYNINDSIRLKLLDT